MFPESVKYNNRYRGPLESVKFKNFNDFLYIDIKNAVEAFNNFEENVISLTKETLHDNKLPIFNSFKRNF